MAHQHIGFTRKCSFNPCAKRFCFILRRLALIFLKMNSGNVLFYYTIFGNYKTSVSFYFCFVVVKYKCTILKRGVPRKISKCEIFKRLGDIKKIKISSYSYEILCYTSIHINDKLILILSINIYCVF